MWMYLITIDSLFSLTWLVSGFRPLNLQENVFKKKHNGN